ncbi:hypothetical protein PR002_g11326 [Phytophthora rubi]|uniref:Uncharacterized protein n=1 Tax=Phytophthora rubi TaxID=129364 RepID=A0A6A3M3R9_9STRA|nr:hypothetical protein PR002_g11326 [Phytophthora rubi]
MYERIKRFNTSPAVNKKVADLRADHVASLGLETGGTLDKIVYFEHRDADMTRASGRARRRWTWRPER